MFSFFISGERWWDSITAAWRRYRRGGQETMLEEELEPEQLSEESIRAREAERRQEKLCAAAHTLASDPKGVLDKVHGHETFNELRHQINERAFGASSKVIFTFHKSSCLQILDYSTLLRVSKRLQ